MKKNLFSLMLVLGFSPLSFSQVGIGTDNPQATLDIHGNLKVRDLSEVTFVSNDYSILMQNNSAEGDSEIIKISSENFSNPSSGTAYSAKKAGGWSLLNLGISGTNWYKINLTGDDDTRVGNPALFTEGVYTAPEDGIYMVSYEFQLEAGVNLDVLGNKRLGLIKNGTEIWEDKFFDAVRVELVIPLLAVPVTSSSITSIVELNEGDTLTFGVETGGVNLNLLTNNSVSVSIFKI
ncbi:MAG TPA: hypothetical protein VKY36_07475 [Moheibacter sp.]|nr:hypothetical protein [Moheibacter sp.]